MFDLFPSSPYHSLNVIMIKADALRHNYSQLQKLHPEARIAPVLKSNAYGHGLTTVAPLFDGFGCPFLVVDSLYEAYELQKLKVTTPILILGYTHPDNFKVKRLPFQVALFDLEVARVLNQYQPGCRVHIFVDTGMRREGVTLAALPAFLTELKQLTNLKVVGVASHLADADNPKSQNFTHQQLKAYDQALSIVRAAGFQPEWRHVSASAGALKVSHPDLNLLRVGLASYGLCPLEERDVSASQIVLQPALEFCSTLAQIKELNKNQKTGYNLTYQASRNMTVGLLPAGYFEGVDRRLSNKGVVTIRGINCPIVGRVSMNMTVVDISHVPQPQVGEEVVIYSSDPGAANTLTQAAKIAETIPYELAVHLNSSVKRVVK